MKNRYFQINLNKRDERTRELEKKRRNHLLQVFLVALIFIALFGAMVYQTRQLDAKIAHRREDLRELEAKIEALEQKADFVGKDDVLALHELDADRVLWSKKLAALSDITPKNVAITNIYFQKDRLRIEGLSKIIPGEKEFDRVVLLMDNIKNNKEFAADVSEVLFEESNRVKIQNENLLNFAVSCRFK